MATIEKRTSSTGATTYRAKVRLRGFPPQSATFERVTDAKKWVQDTESAIREGRYFKTAQAKKHTLSETIDRYIKDVLNVGNANTVNQRNYLKYWQAELGDYTLADLTPDLITASRGKLVGKTNRFNRTIGPSTANRYMEALSHVFTVAINNLGWMEYNPIQKIKKYEEPRGRVRHLDEKEQRDLLRECKASENPHLYVVVVLTLSMGARKEEILGLKWKDVDMERQQVIFHKTKNSERRTLPLRRKAYDLIKDMHEKRNVECPFLFPSDRKCQPVDIRRAWEGARKRAGIQDFRFHDLRHSAASYLAMNGASLREIADVLGQKTLQMVQRYAHLTEAHTHSVVDRMNEKFLSDV